MRTKPHHHPCQRCGAKTECGGTWEQNYDGVPEVICPEFHLAGGVTNADFICERCVDHGPIGPNDPDDYWGGEWGVDDIRRNESE